MSKVIMLHTPHHHNHTAIPQGNTCSQLSCNTTSDCNQIKPIQNQVAIQQTPLQYDNKCVQLPQANFTTSHHFVLIAICNTTSTSTSSDQRPHHHPTPPPPPLPPPPPSSLVTENNYSRRLNTLLEGRIEEETDEGNLTKHVNMP